MCLSVEKGKRRAFDSSFDNNTPTGFFGL